MITYNNGMLFSADSRDVIASIRTEEYENAAEQLIMNPTPDNVKAYKEAVKSLNGGKSVSYTFSNCTINKDMLNELCGSLLEPRDKWYMIFEKKVQCRRHHKRRINKKWSKRYGFKTVYEKYAVDTSNFYINQDMKSFTPDLSEVTAAFLLNENSLTRELYCNTKI